MQSRGPAHAPSRGSPAKPIGHGDFGLLGKRLCVPIVNDAKHCALIRITQGQRDALGGSSPRLIGGDVGGFEQACYSLPNNAHAGLLEDASNIGETPAVRNDQAIERQRVRLYQRRYEGA